MKKTIAIEGMNCGHCTAAVEKALRATAGVNDVSVDLAARQAVVDVADSVSDDQLKAAVTGAGFTVTGIE